MKKIILLLCFIILAFTLTTRSTHNDEQPVVKVGGYSPINANQLSDDQKYIDQFIKSKIPQLQQFHITKGQTQVVQGINYKFVYGKDGNQNQFQVTVWDRSWLKSRNIMSVRKLNSDSSKNKSIQSRDGEFIHAVRQLFKN